MKTKQTKKTKSNLTKSIPAKSSNYYFTEETEKFICLYNNCDNYVIRNNIYTKHIHYPFNKLAENMIHTFNFYYFEVPPIQVQHEVVSHLMMNIGKFDPTKGKAFSYFSVVAKNWLILHNNKNYKNYKIHDTLDILDYTVPINNKQQIEATSELYSEYFDQMLQYWDVHMSTVFPNKKELNIADSILEIFRIRENIENFNKKAIYILIRERSNAKTQQITKIINIMKQHNITLLYEFHKNGILNLNEVRMFT